MATRSRSSACPQSLLIKESWDPLFQQPPLSQQTLNQRSMGKSPSAKQSPLSWDCKTKSSGSSGNLKKPRKQQRKPKTGWEQSTKPSLALRLGVEPRTHQKTGNLRQLRPRPGPYQKPTLFQRLVRPSLPGPTLSKLPPFLPSLLQSGPPKKLYSPSPPPIQLCSPQIPQPAAPVAAYQALVKVDHPDAYTGKIGNKAVSGSHGCWHGALIQTVDKFRTEFLAAFGSPDATQAAERQITQLTQTGTCAEYITKFRTIAMDLDWNDAALCGQFARGLHWEVSRLIATQERHPTTLLELQNAALVIDNALHEERTSHLPKGNKSGSSSTPIGGQVPANRPQDQGASPAIPILSLRRNKTAARLKAYASSAANQGTSLQNAALAGKPHLRRKALRGPAAARKDPKDSGLCIEFCNISSSKISPLFTILITPEKKAEPLEVLIDSGATSSFLHPCTAESLRLPLIDLPSPHTMTMLNGSSPQAGKIWKKANLTFSFDGKHMTKTFLICNTGSHAAILGLKWLDAHNPEINWNQRTLSFPHAPPEHVAIAEEEEADQNPLKEFLPNTINTPRRGPLNSPLYSMTDAKSATLKDWLRDELKAGKIRPSKSSISSPVMFVPKKDGSCQRLPAPRPDNLMAQLRGAKVFTKLDLHWGYNNVQVKEGDKWKTAFRTKYGLYKSLVMTFGLTNAPAAFQHFMNKLFKDLLDVCVIIYLDDILIYSKDDALHTHTFMSLDKLKIQAVQDWPVPTKVKEVQLFLGFANFLCHFVANFSHMARPLHNLVKKDTPWKWDTREQEAFQGLKDAITNALGAKQNYDTHNKELLAIIRSFEYWRIFLEGTPQPITVFTDHCNLEYWKESWTFNQRHAQWHLLLAGYNFQIVYRPGKQSGKPDALSQCADHADIPPADQTMLLDPVFANVALVTPKKELQCQIKASLDQDESLEEILQFLQNESKAPPSIKHAFKDYEMEAGLLFYQGRIVVPDVGTLRMDLLRIFHNSPLAGHPGRQRTLELVSRTYYWPGIRAEHTGTLTHVKSANGFRNPILDPSRVFKKLKAPELADLFLRHVWKRYGMPEKTISDRRRAYSGVNQKDWVKWLPMAEFAYNNAVHSSTGKSPFKALYGWEPSLTPSNIPTDVPEADNLATQMEAQWQEIEAALRQSKTRMVAGEVGEP
ncbi:hypothetical protein RHS01_05438 [Rhizoctonia solani]|uniref:RNA-directed DNA polymerase n=1 Tax=Rhizoctonia solani TaxID=456999 RepID=A0A8H7ID63_9AGAM|nr:hypothetical protein RHS01_05438 [Rhizoctonia solani]